MAQQKRPITGGNGDGSPIALLAAGTVVHTIPAVTKQRVGPVMDQINLFLSNTTGAPITATITIAGVAFVIAVAANSVLQVLEDHPVKGAEAAVTTISVAHGGANSALVAYGSFTRA